MHIFKNHRFYFGKNDICEICYFTRRTKKGHVDMQNEAYECQIYMKNVKAHIFEQIDTMFFEKSNFEKSSTKTLGLFD